MKFMQQLEKIIGFKEPEIHFNDGPTVTNLAGNPPLKVEFWADGVCQYQTSIRSGQWAKASRKFLTKWEIKMSWMFGLIKRTHHFNPSGKRIRINIDSRSLGDTLAWMGQIARYQSENPDVRVFASHFWPDLGFESSYPELSFITPDEDLPDCYAVFNLGFFFDNWADVHPVDPRLCPLGKVASDILGMSYSESRPRLSAQRFVEPCDGPYVCIATTSTAHCKHWLFPDGWQSLVNYLEENGLKTVVIQKEPTNLVNVIDRTGDIPIQQRVSDLMGCQLFIGLGSGLSWLAWALGKPVVLISGFSLPFAEFQHNCTRIINESVCHGCWNDPEFEFERNNWDWCPRQSGTPRAFECTKEISSLMVIEKLSQSVPNSSVMLS